MEKSSASSSRELAQRLYDKNIELENRRRKAAQARVPSDPNAWLQMRENYEAIILEDYNFSEKHNIEYALWQLHYRRIEEFRAHFNAASASISSTTSQTKSGTARSDRASKIRSQFKIFLSEATGFYHDLILKIRAKYGLPIGQFSADSDIRYMEEKDGKKSGEASKGLISCQRCLIYLGDLARYKGLYGEGESKSRDYAAASSYYMQAASLWPSSGNPHHQLAILATYSGDDLVAVYRYFRSLAVSSPFSTARDNLIVAFEKNRQHYSELRGDSKASSIKKSPVQMSRGRGKGEPTSRPKDTNFDPSSSVERKPNIQTIYKAFCTQFVRLNGILFTRTSLETFGEILSLASSSLNELFSSGLEEDPSFDTGAFDNGLFVVMIVSILIFTVSNVKGEAEGQSYADIVQRTVLLQNALVAIYELMGQIFKRCLQLSDLSSSYLLPGILVFLEWMACCPDVVVSDDMDEKQTSSRKSFWNYCISFLNKILSDGLISVDDEETSCFTNMSRYEEGENGNQLALWEDFELRGFLPLHPSQTFLDYSRKHSIGIDSKKDKIARLKRIFAAGKAITNTVKIDKKSVSFDSRLKKFVIGVEPQNLRVTSTTSFESAPATNGEFRQILADSRTDVIGMEPNLPLQLEAEDEDEVIVFKPTMIEKRTDVRSAKFSHKERSEHVQNATLGDSQSNGRFSTLDPKAHQQSTSDTVSQALISISSVTPPYPIQSYQFQPSMWSTNGLVSLADDLKGLSFLDNGHTMKTGTPRELEVSNMPSLSVPVQQSIGFNASGMTYTGAKASETMMGPVVDNASTLFGGAVPQNSVAFSGANSFPFTRNASATLPTSSRKVSANRPIRHLGPPPGFSIRPKQVNEFISGSGQNPVVDDYSWLDGYQLQSSTKTSGYMQSINQLSNLSSQSINNSNGSMGTISFPFPGKQVQVSGVQLEEENEKIWQGHQHLQSLNSRHDQLQQQQYNPLLNQQQGQSMWTGRHLV